MVIYIIVTSGKLLLAPFGLRSEGFFLKMKRVDFLIDGFNLYHSIIDIARYNRGLRVKWLDIRSLCISFLHLIDQDARLKKIYYFSAYAHHLNNPDVIKRHKAYIECLESTNIIPEMGRFKYKEISCPYCHKQIPRYEEKETDVAIGIKICEVLFNDECDIIAIVTGDTDLAPAIRHTQIYYPEKKIIFIFPFARKNSELAQLAPGSFKINKQSYIRHQFPDEVILTDGRTIHKPSTW
jgi:uncharacterized LabA/DUF88 family protein